MAVGSQHSQHLRKWIHWPGKMYLNGAIRTFAIIYNVLHQFGVSIHYLSTSIFSGLLVFMYKVCLLPTASFYGESFTQTGLTKGLLLPKAT